MTSFPIELPPKFLNKAAELRIDAGKISEKFVRGGGSGGQKINKTSSAVDLYYEPLEIRVKCQRHRERKRNRLSAYKLLITKVENIVKGKESEQAKKIFKLRKQKQKRSKRAKEKILEQKKMRGALKKSRQGVRPEDI